MKPYMKPYKKFYSAILFFYEESVFCRLYHELQTTLYMCCLIHAYYNFKIVIFPDYANNKQMLLSFTGSVASAQQSHRSLRADHSDPGRGGSAGTRGSSRLRLYRKRHGSTDATGCVLARCRGSAYPASAGAGDDDLRRAVSGLQAGGRQGRQG